MTGPAILQNGVVPLYSSFNTIQPGEWVSIYGYNLAGQTTIWNGDFPVSLGGSSARINGKAAYLWYVSAGQINLQAPDDTAAGVVPVVVTTAAGTASSTVTLAPFAPSFSLLDTRHVSGIILRPDRSGTSGAGAYDILGPAGTSLGFPTVPAKAGDTIELFGVGFGPTTPAVPAGQVFTGAARASLPITLLINNVGVTPSFAGLSAAGLYQIYFTMPPAVGSGDVLLQARVGAVLTPPGVAISLQAPATTSQLQSLSLSAASIAGGGAVTGTVVLSSAVHSGSAVVALASSSNSLTIPSSVTIQAGSSSTTFTISAAPEIASQTITITASYGGTSAQATLTPIAPAPLSFSSLTMVGSWAVAGYPKISVEWVLQPNAGSLTWTAGGGNLFPTFTSCAPTAASMTVECNTVAPFPGNLLVTTVGFFLNVLTGSLTFTAVPNAPFSYAGTVNGTFSVTGTTSSGATQSYSGPVNGNYSLTP